jgi:hypothetical protein
MYPRVTYHLSIDTVENVIAVVEALEEVVQLPVTLRGDRNRSKAGWEVEAFRHDQSIKVSRWPSVSTKEVQVGLEWGKAVDQFDELRGVLNNLRMAAEEHINLNQEPLGDAAVVKVVEEVVVVAPRKLTHSLELRNIGVMPGQRFMAVEVELHLEHCRLADVSHVTVQADAESVW